MNWLAMGLKIASRIPFERWILRSRDRSSEESALLKRLEEAESRRQAAAPVVKQAEQILEEKAPPKPEPAPTTHGGEHVSTEEIIAYQKRELGKELLLLQRHLAQKCKIAGKACDCCEKHPNVIEALAEETLGITGDKIYEEMANWAREIAPITTEAASASGAYDETYVQLAPVARDLRKRMMGTLSLKPLMTPQMSARATEELNQILDEVDPELRKFTEGDDYE